MTDSDDRSFADVQASSDDGTVTAEREEDGNAGLLDDEETEATVTSPVMENGTISNRYRQILRAQADAVSEEGSVDAAPKRVGSPIDSLMSVPDDSPSVQASEVLSLATRKLMIDP